MASQDAISKKSSKILMGLVLGAVVGIVVGLSIGYVMKAQAESSAVDQQINDLEEKLTDLEEASDNLQNQPNDLNDALLGIEIPIASLGTQKYFLRIEDIPGESEDDAHKDWIDVFSYEHNVSLVGISDSVREFTIMKEIDKASPKLAEAVCSMDNIRIIEFEVVSGNETIVKITLHDVMVSSINMVVSFDMYTHMEDVSFAYQRIEWKYYTDTGTGPYSRQTVLNNLVNASARSSSEIIAIMLDTIELDESPSSNSPSFRGC